VRARNFLFPTPVLTGLANRPAPVLQVPGFLPGGKAYRAWSWPRIKTPFASPLHQLLVCLSFVSSRLHSRHPTSWPSIHRRRTPEHLSKDKRRVSALPHNFLLSARDVLTTVTTDASRTPNTFLSLIRITVWPDTWDTRWRYASVTDTQMSWRVWYCAFRTRCLIALSWVKWLCPPWLFSIIQWINIMQIISIELIGALINPFSQPTRGECFCFETYSTPTWIILRST
jgi:hypothetical protein